MIPDLVPSSADPGSAGFRLSASVQEESLFVTLESMKTDEKFPYDLPLGSAVDYVNNAFLLVIKDDFWNDDQLKLMKQPLDLHFGYTNGLAMFILEGGAIDSADFYFNIQECDEKEALLNAPALKVELVLVDEDNNIRFYKSKDLSAAQSDILKKTFEEQAAVEFMPGEYDVNVEGLQSAYEPFDLVKFARMETKL